MDEERRRELERRLAFRFQEVSHLEDALTHSSVKTDELIGPRQTLFGPCAHIEDGRMPDEARRVQRLGRELGCSWERS